MAGPSIGLMLLGHNIYGCGLFWVFREENTVVELTKVNTATGDYHAILQDRQVRCAEGVVTADDEVRTTSI